VDPFEATIQLLCTIPGMSRGTAEVIVAELGTDLARFPDADHLAAGAVTHTKNTFLAALYNRRVRRMPAQRPSSRSPIDS
jgi:transposase